MAFSPDGALLAVGDAIRDVRLFRTDDATCLNSGKWQWHTTRVTALSWNSTGTVRRLLC
jgi:WD40 repeat protein